nr:glycosyltransferase [Chitinophagales bacterium]
MKLSIIILNYNVKYFLEQALLSVRKAAAGIAAEIIVVDNNSVDGSVAMVRQKFPEAILIANQNNPGFAAGNNQGMRIARGQYILLLNPDTVVEEDTLKKCIDFMDAHPDAGALGVRMYDGKGNFLPESKRGLPTPAVAFYKMAGLGSLFPHSKRFNYYYLGHLNPNQVQQIEVLSGAFMFMSKAMLDKVGLLDEAFFMYGEDIDLSYRITQAGYKNYYLPTARIIHYKGESTKRGSLNYVRVFYNAMIIFARKHFSGDQARLFVLGIQAAIYFKAALTIAQNMMRQVWLPLLDAAMLYAGMYGLKNLWQNNLKAAENLTYPPEYMLVNVPLYVGIWLLSVFLSGGYDQPMRVARVIRGLLFGTLLISAVYGFLPEMFRFSRGMILAGSVWAIFTTTFLRLIIHFVQYKSLAIDHTPKTRAVIVGSLAECKRVNALLHQSGVQLDLIGYVQTTNDNTTQTDPLFLGNTQQLKEIAAIYKLNELIFCGRDLPSQQIIQFMIDIGQTTDYKIVPQESLSIIGSNSKNTAGDLYAIDINLHLNQTRHRRNKRLFDVTFAVLLLCICPVLL